MLSSQRRMSGVNSQQLWPHYSVVRKQPAEAGSVGSARRLLEIAESSRAVRVLLTRASQTRSFEINTVDSLQTEEEPFETARDFATNLVRRAYKLSI